MIPTLHQLSIEKFKRIHKIRRNKVAPFLGAPQRIGVVYKIATCHHVNLIQLSVLSQKYVYKLVVKECLQKYQV